MFAYEVDHPFFYIAEIDGHLLLSAYAVLCTYGESDCANVGKFVSCFIKFVIIIFKDETSICFYLFR